MTSTTLKLDDINGALRDWGIASWIGCIGGNVYAVHVGRRTLTLNGGQREVETPATLDVYYHAAREGESDMPTETTEVRTATEAVTFLLACPKSREEDDEATLAELRRTETAVEREILANFLIAALWADARDDNGEEVDTAQFDEDDVQADVATWIAVRKMIRAFLADLDPIPGVTGDGVRAAAREIVHGDPNQAGLDLWLTMRHHGVGFWDRGYKVAVGKFLTELADRHGTEDASIYVRTAHDSAEPQPWLDFPACTTRTA